MNSGGSHGGGARAVAHPPAPALATHPTVLASIGYYLPGYLAGGPVRSLSSMVERCSDAFRFRVVTADRDWKVPDPYPEVVPGRWARVGAADVLYLDPARTSFASWRRLLRSTPHDVLYLNSFHSPPFTIRPLLLWRAGMVPRVPVVLAPRGEFSPGALALKWRKKQAQLAVFRALAVCRDVFWHAASPGEAADIRTWFGAAARVAVAANISAAADAPAPVPVRHTKMPGRLRIAFLSRVQRKKNLDGALRLLTGARGEVEFNVYGPREDATYWEECRCLADRLPSWVRVTFHGPVTTDAVPGTLAANDVFFLPTHGENFGHVILEALLAGCPVIVSDQTPWRGLEAQGVGWDIPLDRPDLFHQALATCVAMDARAHHAMSRRAREYALATARASDAAEETRRLFRQALGGEQ